MERVWDNRIGRYIDIPSELDAFLSELDTLFRKYNLIIDKDDFEDIIVRELTDEEATSDGHLLIVCKDYGNPIDFTGILQRFSFVRKAYLLEEESILAVETDDTTKGFGELICIFGHWLDVLSMDYLRQEKMETTQQLKLVYEREEI